MHGKCSSTEFKNECNIPGSLQEQRVPLTAERSLRPLFSNLLWSLLEEVPWCFQMLTSVPWLLPCHAYCYNVELAPLTM